MKTVRVWSRPCALALCAMLMSGAVVAVIERQWTTAAFWCAVASVLSVIGLMHSYQWTVADTALSLSPAWPFVIGYAVMSVVFFSAQWITEEGDPRFERNDMFVAEVCEFAARARGEAHNGIGADAQQGIEVLKIALAALQSAAEGRRIDLHG